ncbi:MAG: hypothetical protein ACI4EX_06185, partial [Lachnospiraceae bacterium]
IYRLSPFERSVATIKYFEGLHQVSDAPYVGYGHRLLPGEHYRLPLSRKQADALLRRDLRKLCKMFRSYGKDSLLLATLAYNVGYGTLMGNRRTSEMRAEGLARRPEGESQLVRAIPSEKEEDEVNAHRPKSQLVQKIERGDRDIYQDYISFCRYKGKVVPSIRRRRIVEYRLLYMSK